MPTSFTTLLPSPSSLSASTSGGAVELSWTNNDNSSDGGIDVERSTDSFSTLTTVATGLAPSTTTYTDTSTTGGTTYEYRIERTTDHTEATSASAQVRAPKTLSRSTQMESDAKLDITRSTVNTRSTQLETDAKLDITRSTVNARSTQLESGGRVNARQEFNEVIPDEQTADLSWDFIYDPIGFASEWVYEDSPFPDGEVDAFTVVFDLFVDNTFCLRVQYDATGDGTADYTTEEVVVDRDGKTVAFPELGEDGYYRFVIQKMRPNDHLRALTFGPTRF